MTPHASGEPAASSKTKTERTKTFDEEAAKKIEAMSKPSDMPYEERKRQYAAMRRQIYREAPPALLAKYSLAPDAERSLASISCHTCHATYP